MRARSTRRFTLLDAMILLAATAIGVQGLRVIWDGTTLGAMVRNRAGRWTPREVLALAPHAVNAAAPVVAAWSAALLALRFRRPRPSRRRLGTQPGAVACAAAVLGLTLIALDGLLGRAVAASSEGTPWLAVATGLDPWRALSMATIDFRNGAGLMVAGAWLALALGRRRRPEPSWIDRAGRAAGVYWLLMIPWYRLLEALMLFRIVTLS